MMVALFLAGVALGFAGVAILYHLILIHRAWRRAEEAYDRTT